MSDGRAVSRAGSPPPLSARSPLFAQIGLRLAGRLNETLRERAEQFAGLALVGLALLLAAQKLAV
jgi:hypothetical protein